MTEQPKIVIALSVLDDENFQKSFTVLQDGLWLVDANGDTWALADTDGTHLIYYRSKFRFEQVDKHIVLN